MKVRGGHRRVEHGALPPLGHSYCVTKPMEMFLIGPTTFQVWSLLKLVQHSGMPGLIEKEKQTEKPQERTHEAPTCLASTLVDGFPPCKTNKPNFLQPNSTSLPKEAQPRKGSKEFLPEVDTHTTKDQQMKGFHQKKEQPEKTKKTGSKRSVQRDAPEGGILKGCCCSKIHLWIRHSSSLSPRG